MNRPTRSSPTAPASPDTVSTPGRENLQDPHASGSAETGRSDAVRRRPGLPPEAGSSGDASPTDNDGGSSQGQPS